jgi:hypothetical protein
LPDRNQLVEFIRSNMQQEASDDDQVRANLGVDAPFVVAVDPLAGGPEAPAATTATPKKGRSAKSQSEPRSQERALAGLVTEGLASAAITQAGQAPRWLALGLGAYLAQRFEPRHPYYDKLRAETAQQYRVGWSTRATEVLGDSAPDDRIKALGFSLVEWMTSAYRTQFPAFVRALVQQGGTKLDEVVKGVFGAGRQEFLAGWGQWVAAKYGRMNR